LHAYDRLVIATGSRPCTAAEIPTALEGVFTLRNRRDADRIMEAAARCESIVVVGGGLLGLETAAALRERCEHVVILHRSGRLMRQQLDGPASAWPSSTPA
jgi:ferredoxin-nitrate reductase